MMAPAGRNPKQRLLMLSLASRKVLREILRAQSREEVLNGFARIMVESAGFAMAAIGWHDPETNELIPVARFGDSTGYLDRVRFRTDRRPEGLGPAGVAFREGRPNCSNDFQRDPRTKAWWNEARGAGWHSVAAIPIQLRGRPVAILAVYAREAGYFGDEELELIEEVALDVGFALEELEREEDLRKMQAALAESQDRLVQAVRVADIGIFDFRTDDDCMYASPELSALHGFPPEERMPVRRALENVHPADRERVLRKFEAAKDGEDDGRFDQEYRLLLADGTVKWVRHRSKVMSEDSQAGRRAVRIVGAVTEITKERQAQEDRATLEGRLAQAHKMESIGKLAGGVAHDFNNMLTVILGYASLAKLDFDADSSQLQSIEEIEKAARRSIEMTKQLLEFSRQHGASPAPANLNRLISEMRQPLARMIGEDVVLSLHPSDDLWTVVIDHSQVDRILLNLAVNARDAMPNGGKLTIETDNIAVTPDYARFHPDSAPGNYVLLAVSDTGIGIAPDTLKRIFEPYFTTKEQGKGTGLGLATVYAIVKQNGGFINVYSELEHGTTFKIYLPQRSDGGTANLPEVHVPLAKTGRGSVLLVEDDELVRTMTTLALETLGYKAHVADGPKRAIELCAHPELEIQLMLTDVVMPNMSGSELRDRVLSVRPSMKILFMSGYTSNAIVNQGVLAPGERFIQKPFSIAELGNRIEEILKSS